VCTRIPQAPLVDGIKKNGSPLRVSHGRLRQEKNSLKVQNTGVGTLSQEVLPAKRYLPLSCPCHSMPTVLLLAPPSCDDTQPQETAAHQQQGTGLGVGYRVHGFDFEVVVGRVGAS
jgi:hypothetical protein